MGMSVHLSAYLERDDKYREMAEAYNACVKVRATPPKEVMEFLGVEKEFGHIDPEMGVSFNLENTGFCARPEEVACDTYEIDLKRLLEAHPTVSKIRFQLSY